MAGRAQVVVAGSWDSELEVSSLLDDLVDMGFDVTTALMPRGVDLEAAMSIANGAEGLAIVVGPEATHSEEVLGWTHALAHESRLAGVPTAVMVGVAGDGAPGDTVLSFDADIITTFPAGQPWQAISRVARFIDERMGVLGIDLRLHPPAVRPAPDDAGVVASEVEGLLLWAERFVADEQNPDEVRDEVDRRRRQLLDELALTGQGKGSSAVLTGLAAALLPLVRPEASADGLGVAVDEVADGLIALGEATSDEEVVDAGEEVVAALDHVTDEMARYGVEDLKETALRTAGAWIQEDFRGHLNGFITAERGRGVGVGAAGGAATIGLGGPPWLAVVTVVALGLLRARFPWIFRREDPEDDE